MYDMLLLQILLLTGRTITGLPSALSDEHGFWNYDLSQGGWLLAVSSPGDKVLLLFHKKESSILVRFSLLSSP